MKFLLTLFALVLSTTFIFAQTSNVQSFTYESTTRDTVVTFPTDDHNSYEKILMHYSMRCKDGLVSTGSERNKGCGEWDYSCNTYVVDSTRVDSLKARSDEFNFPGFGGEVFNYSTTPTYTYYQSTKTSVTYSNTLAVFDFPFIEGTETDDYSFGQDGSGLQLEYLVPASFLEDDGIDRISGIELDIISGESRFKNMKVYVAETDATNISDALSEVLDWELILNDNVILSKDDNVLKFFEDYRWDDESSIVFRISYDEATSTGFEIQSQSSTEVSASVTSNSNAYYKSFSSGGGILVDKPFEEISNEITISYWLRGSEIQPVNSTVLEGNDDSNRRQVNIHHPWSNGQIYWDCGNNGSGYDRINKPSESADLYKNEWNHWAFTKNAVTGNMRIYLNGEMWHSGTDKFHPIDMTALNIGGSITSNNLSYFGDLDELRVWNKELDQNTIQSYMRKTIDQMHPNNENLMLYFKFDEDQDYEVDLSGKGRNGVVEGLLATRKWDIESYDFDTGTSNFIPNQNLLKGTYIKSVNDYQVRDSVQNLPQLINHYTLNGTDLELVWSEYYHHAAKFPVYDEDGVAVDSVGFDSDGTFERGELIYYSKVPMAYEIMSFVTPYGIGLDFGLEGLTWTFDVTDLGPVLKGDKRIYMTAGGQWQEDMDIRFEFIKGTPDRDVIDIQQIWPVRSTGYTNILSDWRYEPRQFQYDDNVASYVIKTAITGHGQQGEFIPRNHTVDVDGFTDTWQVWKECADNPVYPQGGTWVYDRAGWCPGMATDVRTYDVTPYFKFADKPFVDYTIATASGDSRYYVNSQLVSYGPANKTNDAGIVDIINPSTRIEHGRFNPSCYAPQVVLKNHGSETMRNATITYGIVGESEATYEWTGTLNFLGTTVVTLPNNLNLTQGGNGSEFFAKVQVSNDEDNNNDEIKTSINIPDHYEGGFVIETRTNSVKETSYRVEDIDGNVLLNRAAASLSNNSVYRDTLNNLNGCFRVIVTDSDQDGISWWANNDGNGYVRVKEIGKPWQTIATDFGAFIEYNFTSGIISNIDNLEKITTVNIYPNPGSGDAFLTSLNGWDNEVSVTVNDVSGKSILSKNVQAITISNRPLNFLQNLDSGIYFINIQDSKRIASVKYIRL